MAKRGLPINKPGGKKESGADKPPSLRSRSSGSLTATRLREELQDRTRELAEAFQQQSATSEVLRVISRSKFDLSAVFETIVERAAVLCEAEHAWAGRLVEDGILLDAYRGPSEEIAREVGSVRYLTDELRRAGAQTLNLDDALEHPLFGETVLVQTAHMRGFLVVPLRRDGQDIGSIILARSRPGRFTDRQVQLVETFADQAVIAIENVRLFTEAQHLLKETEHRNAELAIINSVQEGLASKLTMQEVYDLVGDKIREIFHADTTYILSYSKEDGGVFSRYYVEQQRRLAPQPVPPGRGIYTRVMETRQAFLVNSSLQGDELGALHVPSPGSKQDLNESGLYIPILLGDELKGIVSIQSHKANAYDQGDLRLLQTLANSMSVALENARLWEQERLFRKALQRELEIGREIQAGFLPERLPLVEGWEIAATLEPAREVAGDFYDVFELPGGNIGLVIADVCDKGVGAALFMTLIRSLVRMSSNQEYFERLPPADFHLSASGRVQRAMSLTNNYIAETHGVSGMFATLFFGIVNPGDGALTYANGGHEPPYLIRSGGVREVCERTGPAVGVMADREFAVLTSRLEIGDVLFAYTDGVPDCQNSQGEFFGHDRLADLLKRDAKSSSEIVAGVETALHNFAKGTTQFDDITLLAVRRASSQS